MYESSYKDFKISDLCNLETIVILDTQKSVTKTVEEEMARDQFIDSLTQNDE